MTGNAEIVQEPIEMAKNTNSCSGCGSEINADAEMCPNCSAMRPGISQNLSSSDIINKDPIADSLLRLCAIINGTWNDIRGIRKTPFCDQPVKYYLNMPTLILGVSGCFSKPSMVQQQTAW